MIVCLGELLLRLSAPGRELLLQSPRLVVHVGGAEANVAISLSEFGHSTALASVIPDNALGRAAVGELRRHGVDTSRSRFAPGRMGLYFLATGAAQRPSEVIYDRAGSAFAEHADALDVDAALAGADALHVSGITPALGARPFALVRRALETAAGRGLAVSFDCNYRAKLWESCADDAGRMLGECAGLANTLFGGARDLALILGRQFGGADGEASFREAGAAAFEAFPRLERIATLARAERTVDHHDLTAWMQTRTSFVTGKCHEVGPIVDRIGAGDAFAAGVLHGLRRGFGEQETLEFGLAAACLKHSVPGDFNLAREADVRALMDGTGFGVRR